MKTANALQRGKACLSCRKRKMKCDGQRPICGQCVKGNRDGECQYHDKKQISRTEMLRAKVAKLEARLRELEVENSGSSSNNTPAPMSPSVSPSPSAPGSSPSGDMILLQQPGTSLPSSSSASIGFDWDDDDRLAMDAGPSSISSSSSTPWLGDLFDASTSFGSDALLDLGMSDYSSGLVSRQSPNHWEDPGLMSQNQQKLLDIFFAHRHQCSFDVHVERFKASMILPPPQQPHPALLDAIYLMACYFSQPQYDSQEQYYLQQALSGISSSLQDSDRLIQIVQASCLIAVYFFSRGRTLEGYYHSSTAARLAVSLGLHQIKSEDWFNPSFELGSSAVTPQPAFLTFKSSLKLPAPRDSVDYGERIAAFWQVFSVDRAWSVASGLPAALPDDDNSPRARVETTWPSVISDAQDMLECLQPLNDNSKLNPYLRAKVVTLFERSYRIASKTFENDDLFWSQHNALDVEISQFGAGLSPLQSSVYQEQLFANDIELVSIHTLMHASTIHLHRDLLMVYPASYQRCLVAANAITSLIRELNDGDYPFLNPIISSCWKCAFQVYLQVLEMQQTRLLQSILNAINTQLDTLVNALTLLGRMFPIAAHDAQKAESERTMRISSLALFVPS